MALTVDAEFYGGAVKELAALTVVKDFSFAVTRRLVYDEYGTGVYHGDPYSVDWMDALAAFPSQCARQSHPLHVRSHLLYRINPRYLAYELPPNITLLLQTSNANVRKDCHHVVVAQFHFFQARVGLFRACLSAAVPRVQRRV